MKRSLVVRKQSGFSLAELMVAMVLGIILIGAVYNTYMAQTRSYNVQEQVAEMQQTARVAMDMILRDVRMAGYQAAGFTVPNSNAIVAINSSTDPDGIIASDNQGLSTTLTANASAGAGSITVMSVDPNGDGTVDFSQNAGVIISDGVRTQGFTITGVAGTVLTLSGSLAKAYLAANTVVVPAVVYDVVGTDLRRNGLVLARNIEDLQFAYVFADGDQANAPNDTDGDATNNPADIRSVRIDLLVRSDRVDPDFNGARPALEDHGVGPTDHYRRRLLTTVVSVRNMGL
jgi:prepilin-type N-terminal cleavage/methylation domain-containing protein